MTVSRTDEPLRPPLLVVIAGTGTEIGKTWVACRLAGAWRQQGLRVAARKPAQSYDAALAGPTDAELLALATGESPRSVCPLSRWYPKALAPPMAAAVLGMPPFSIADLAGELSWPASAQAGLVELAGGLGSPQAADGDGVDLVARVAPDLVVLVSGAGLGALGAVRLAERALGGARLAVYLNHFAPADELHAANLRWLGEHCSAPVAVTPVELVEQLAALGEHRPVS